MTAPLTLYGIKNCDTVKKARQWLDNSAIAYRFHDFRVDGLDQSHLEYFLSQCDWEALLNRRSTTWKDLDPSQKSALNAHTVIPLFLQHPTLIKRPVLDTGESIVIGFNTTAYQAKLIDSKQ